MSFKKEIAAFLLGLLIILGLGLGILTFLLQERKPATTTLASPTPTSRPGKMAIKLVGQPKITVNQRLTAEIVFEATGQSLAGVDAVLLFDPKVISIAQLFPNQELFEQLPLNRQQEDQGVIKIAAFLPKKAVVGQQRLISFDFQLKEEKPTVLTLKFNGQGELGDSNLLDQTDQQDILGQVLPLRLEP